MLLKLCKKCVYFYTSYSNCVNIHGYCSSSIYYLLISRSLHFFSLFSRLNKLSNFSSPHLLLFSQMHTNTSTQTNQHKDTLAKKKKKNTHTQRYTNTPIHKQTQTGKQQRDRSVLIKTINARLEQSELVGLTWSELVGLAWSELVGMGLAWSTLES